MRSQGSIQQYSTASTSHVNGGVSAAVSTIAADADHFWVVERIDYSYSSTPTAGGLTVEIGGTLLLDIDITAAGPGVLDFSQSPLYASDYAKSEALVVTLKDGGASTQKLTVRYR